MDCLARGEKRMPRERILIVEDEEDILELERYNLEREGYRVNTVMSGEEALKIVKAQEFDLIILDLMLPGLDGLEVCKRIKNNPDNGETAIVMITAKGDEADIVTGLELGADDYITKPFSPRVLLARIKAVLRRREEPALSESDPISIHDLDIHPGRHEVSMGGAKLSLTASEFKILHFMARRPGWVFTREQIIKALHGDDYPVTDRSIDVQIVGLRKKLGEAGQNIETVRGIGYKMRE